MKEVVLAKGGEMRTKKLTGEQILKALRERKDTLKKYKIKKIGVFGSYVKGGQKEDSDIDFIVEFELSAFGEGFKGLFDTFMDLSSYLENLFGKKVDILTPVSIESIRIKEVAEEIKGSIVYA